MVFNKKEKKENKSKNSKKQVQSKESKALRLIKERKRKAQLRTNPALSIYESGRERTKRVVKKEYPLVNINKLPSILNKGNDNIGVVWKNTNKIQTHTLFSSTNLPSREPASKDDIFYLIAPFNEPNSIDIVEEFKKYKIRFAKENQNRYTDIKSKIENSKISKKLNDTGFCQDDKKIEQKLNIPMALENKVKEEYDVEDSTYEESLKNNFIPLISTFSTNPLEKGRLISEMGLDKSLKNNDTLHKINKNKINRVQNKLISKANDNIYKNKGLFNNFNNIMDSIQPLDSILSAKPMGVKNSLISDQSVTIPNLDFINEPLDLSKVKMEEDLILNNNNLIENKVVSNNLIPTKTDDDFLFDLLNLNENGLNNPKPENSTILNNSMLLPSPPFIESVIPPPPKPKRKDTLDDILAPFKAPLDEGKIKYEPKVKNSFSSFNCFNIDDLNLPKIELPQEMKTSGQIKNTNTFPEFGFKEKIDINKFGLGSNDELKFDNPFIKKELPNTPEENKFKFDGLGDIAKFSTTIPSNKLKSIKIENPMNQYNGLDMSKVKYEEEAMTMNVINNNPICSPMPLDQLGNMPMIDMNNALLNNFLNTNDNALLGMEPNLISNVPNTNIAIDCYNTELNYINSSLTLPNTLEYVNNLNLTKTDLPSEYLISTPENKDLLYSAFNNEYELDTIGCSNSKSKDAMKEPLQHCSSCVPLATTTSASVKAIPDWYNQNGMNIDFMKPETFGIIDDSPQMIKPLVPADEANNNNNNNDVIVTEISNKILNDTTQYTSFLNTEIPEIPLTITETTDKSSNETVNNNSMEVSIELEKKDSHDELPENIVNDIIERLANDDKLKEQTCNSCFIGKSIQDTSKLLKKMSMEMEKIVSNSDHLETSEKKWKEWRKDIIAYENEAHQWLNARIEFYSRRVNEYRKDWIEYWIKRYLMQQKQQIKSLSYYINIPQNLQFATSFCGDSETNDSNVAPNTPSISTTPSNTTSSITTPSNAATSITTPSNVATSITTPFNTDKKNTVKSVGRETIEQFKKQPTSLTALMAEVSRDPRLEVIGRTIEVANKQLLNDPKKIAEYHEKLLNEKELLLGKYDMVDSLDIVPSNLIKPITNVGDNNLVNRDTEDTSMMTTSDSKGYQGGRGDNEEIASVLIDEYVKAPFESKRIFIHGIPKDYQLMFNDKMKSLIFILDKCIQDKKD